MRIGFGFDIHQLKEGLDLWIGGVRIPHSKGAVAHSDGDVLIHAICDALLGAAALGDIGRHFPDHDPGYKGIDSKLLLKKVAELVNAQGYSIVNIDSTLCLQAPKIAPFVPQMIKTLAAVLNIRENQISVKATTNERLGFIGREEGLQAYAVALIDSGT